jgi:hypothetical protein
LAARPRSNTASPRRRHGIADGSPSNSPQRRHHRRYGACQPPMLQAVGSAGKFCWNGSCSIIANMSCRRSENDGSSPAHGTNRQSPRKARHVRHNRHRDDTRLRPTSPKKDAGRAVQCLPAPDGFRPMKMGTIRVGPTSMQLPAVPGKPRHSAVFISSSLSPPRHSTCACWRD